MDPWNFSYTRRLYSCFLVNPGELPKLWCDVKVMAPLLLLFFIILLKFFPLILLEQRPLSRVLFLSLGPL